MPGPRLASRLRPRPARRATLKAPVTGTFGSGATRGQFHGNFMPRKFTVRHGVLEATGVLRGKLVRANGMKFGTVRRTVTMPVRTPKAGAVSAAARCSILNLHLGTLNLHLGTLNLNLLGLVVHLNPVHLIITAVPGAGNLLGNLLCQITALLNGTGNLGLLSSRNVLLSGCPGYQIRTRAAGSSHRSSEAPTSNAA